MTKPDCPRVQYHRAKLPHYITPSSRDHSLPTKLRGDFGEPSFTKRQNVDSSDHITTFHRSTAFTHCNRRCCVRSLARASCTPLRSIPFSSVVNVLSDGDGEVPELTFCGDSGLPASQARTHPGGLLPTTFPLGVSRCEFLPRVRIRMTGRVDALAHSARSFTNGESNQTFCHQLQSILFTRPGAA